MWGHRRFAFLYEWYWAWRLSIWSRPYYYIKTLIHLHLNARKTAVALDDCMRAFGQMNHTSSYKGKCRKCGEKITIDSPDKNCMLMKLEVRSALIERGYWHTLPNGWKWRKD